MEQGKIDKLRELAERGVGGEKENARSILQKNGIDWRKPVEENLIDRIKKTVGVSIQHEFVIEMEHSSDTLLLGSILNHVVGIKKFRIDSNYGMRFRCTKAQSELIGKLFYSIRNRFALVMSEVTTNFIKEL